MGADNSQIAAAFGEIADLLELKGDNPFRIRAYRNAARYLERMSRQASQMLSQGEDLSRLPGIGKDLAAKIAEMSSTGRLAALEAMKRGPDGRLIQLLHVPDLGPRRVRLLREELGIESLPQLEEAARAGRLRLVPGFGPVLEARILRHLGLVDKARVPWSRADAVARSLLAHMKSGGAGRVEAAGSYRRRLPTVGDLDLVAEANLDGPAVRRFLRYPGNAETVAAGGTKASMRLKDGFQVDLRVVPPESFGAAMLYFTGSRSHNIHLRALAKRRGLKLNEYGLFRGKSRLAGRTEEEVYAALGLSWIDPRRRENHGEIEAAMVRR